MLMLLKKTQDEWIAFLTSEQPQTQLAIDSESTEKLAKILQDSTMIILREKMKGLGLRIYGNKNELIQLIIEHVKKHPEKTEEDEFYWEKYFKVEKPEPKKEEEKPKVDVPTAISTEVAAPNNIDLPITSSISTEIVDYSTTPSEFVHSILMNLIGNIFIDKLVVADDQEKDDKDKELRPHRKRRKTSKLEESEEQKKKKAKEEKKPKEDKKIEKKPKEEKKI